MSIKIKDIPVNDRPIERLINNGAELLSNEELLAILIRTGTKNNSAKELALNLLAKIKGINNLNNVNYHFLKSIKGIGKAKSAIILAAIEIGKRINKIENINGEIFNSSDIVFEYFKPIFKNKKQEYFYIIYLDSSKRIIEIKNQFIGTLNYSLVHPREIFKDAYLLCADSIICVHNHPSGNVKPSNDDLEITQKLTQIGKIHGIKVIDHIIIGKNDYYSFFENGEIR